MEGGAPPAGVTYVPLTPGVVSIENENLKILFSETTGLPESVIDKEAPRWDVMPET